MFRSIAVISSLIAVFMIYGCVKKQESESAGAVSKHQPSFVSEVSSIKTRPDKAPNFSWIDSTGKTVDFDTFRGKVTLVNFWATWCVPCKRELPDLATLSKELSDQNVKIMGISTDRGANVIDDVASYVRENGIPYQNVISNDELEEAFGNIRMIPTSFLIDNNGTIVQTFIGGRSKEFFTQAITALLQ